jgi:PAS domain S-box-containing protein
MDPGYADLPSAGLFLEECLLGQETDSRQMHGVFPSRRLIAAACTLVAVQVLVLAAQNPTRTLTSASEFIQFALGLVAILACRNAFQRSRGIGKYPWRFLTISFAIWTIAQGFGMTAAHVGQWLANVSDALFFLSAAPFGMLVFLDPDDPSESFDRLHVLDFIQVGVFWLSIFLYFSERVWSPSTAWAFGPFLWSRNIAFDAVLAAMLLLRTILNRSRSVGRFFLQMAMFRALSGLADSYSMNPTNGVQSGDWFDLVWTVLLAIPILIAVSWKDAEQAPRELRSQNVAVNQVFPLLYPFLSFLMLAYLDSKYPLLSPCIFVFTFVTLALRILIIQHRQHRSQEQLQLDAKKLERSEQALRQSEVQYRLLFNTNPIPMWVFDRDSLRFLAVNKAAIRHYGFSEQEFLAMTIADIRPEEDVPKLLANTARRVQGLQEAETWRHRKKDGTIIHVEIIGHDLRFHGVDAELIAAYDITRRREAEHALIQAEEKYRGIFEDAAVGMFQAAADGRPVGMNHALAEIEGYDLPDEALKMIPNILMHWLPNPHQAEEVRRELQEKGAVRNLELEFSRNDCKKRNIVANLRAVRDDCGTVTLLEGTVKDITDRKRAEERIQLLAYYDALTGLPNRTLLQDRLGQALASAQRRDEKVALLFLDLDRFKIINDSLGHSFGDLLLQETAAQKVAARAGHRCPHRWG